MKRMGIIAKAAACAILLASCAQGGGVKGK